MGSLFVWPYHLGTDCCSSFFVCRGVKRSEEAGFSLWLAGAEGSLKDEYPHMTAAALRNEAMQRWGGLSNDEKEVKL